MYDYISRQPFEAYSKGRGYLTMLKNAISMHSDAVFGSKNVQYSCSEYETFVKHREMESASEGPGRPIYKNQAKKERTSSFTLAEGS